MFYSQYGVCPKKGQRDGTPARPQSNSHQCNTLNLTTFGVADKVVSKSKRANLSWHVMTSPGSISIGVVPANDNERNGNGLNEDVLGPEEDKGTNHRFTASPVHISESDDDEEDGEGAKDSEDRRNGKYHTATESRGEHGHDDDEEDGSDDEDEDEEPTLKYQRITGSIPDALRKDSASALAISNKVMVLLFSSSKLQYLYNCRQWALIPVSFTLWT